MPLPKDHPNTLELEGIGRPLDWEAVFGSQACGARRILELGCATGTFLLHRAALQPPAVLIGVEFANKYFRKTAERARKRGLANLKAIRTEAGAFVHNILADNSLDECHIYHPDPWPKERHHKRRLLQAAFVEDLHRALRPGGEVVFQSDHAEYFQWGQERLARRFEIALHPEPWADAPAGRTNWEIKFLRAGQPIWRLVARRA
ncbi:MAG: tRNA (guanosine(46)-N7)-methyltransferase TrmB [Planctomycetota bacterium]